MQKPALPWIDDATPLPPTALAMGADSGAPGLLAAGGSLTLERLNEAYRQGIFPWFSDGQPVLWWAPDPRMVLRTAEFKLHRSLRKTLQKFLRTPGCDIRFDTAFARVIAACAGTLRDGQRGTWIVPPMQRAYTAWHRAGAAHSVETWIDGRLVGGLYGINIGRMFFGESMFSHASDASKIALAALVAFCRANAIDKIDCQQNTEHLASLGAREMPRTEFEAHVSAVVDQPAPRWAYDPSQLAELVQTL
jgi:leucyl/phenylalanyl-tRNA---protein transferase